MSKGELYFCRLAAAFVRGRFAAEPALRDTAQLSAEHYTMLFNEELDLLTDEQQTELIELGIATGLRLHKFKQTMALARVQRVIGALRGLMPVNMLDIGSGRGTFLWPLLDAFPALEITAVDHDERRARDINAVRNGGIHNLAAHQQDATALEFADNSFDVVTMLEVLEHIPDAQQALCQAVRVAQRFVLISVPSKEDDNPEHIHLFDQDRLTRMFTQAGITRVRFEYLLNHIIAVAKKAE